MRPLSAVVAAIASVSALFAQRVPDMRVDHGTASSTSPHMAVVDDSVYLAWEDDRTFTFSPDVYFNGSVDGGATWLPQDVKMNTSAPGAWAINPDIAGAGSAVYVAWSESRQFANPDLFLNRSLDRGATWLAQDVQINRAGGSSAHDVELAASGSNVYAVWQDWRNIGADIYFNRSLDQGATWMPADVRIDTGSAPGTHYSLQPRIAVSGNAVYAVWTDFSPPGYDIHFNRSLDGGATWLPAPVRLDTDLPVGEKASWDPRIAVAGNAIYVTWWDARHGDSDIYFNRSLDQGTTWLLDDVRLDTGSPAGSAESVEPRIAAVGSSVYVVWQDDRDGAEDIYCNVSLDAGTTWLPQGVRLDTGSPPGAAESLAPRLAATGSSVFVAWQERRHAVAPQWLDDVYFNRSTDQGATWLAQDVRLDTGNPAGTARSREIQVGAVGPSPVVAWQDDRADPVNTDDDIYFNIPFGFLPYGSGTPGTGGLTPKIAGDGPAALGESVSIDITQGLGGAAGALLVGGTGSKVSIPFYGGTLLVLPALAPAFALGAGGAFSLPLTIPNDSAYVGVDLYLQALVIDSGAPFGLAMTAGSEMWIG